MAPEQTQQDQERDQKVGQKGEQEQPPASSAQTAQPKPLDGAGAEADGLKDKKPEDLTPEELRLMADTMPGEGPGD